MSQIKWGYTEFGKHTLVKLKVTLTDLRKNKLQNMYSSLVFSKAKKDNSWIIQGCLCGDKTFKKDLKSALLQTKIYLLENQLVEHQRDYHVIF